jgi:hypothetical protein
MSELIKREDAIKATWQEPSCVDPYNILAEVRDRIKALPTASPWHRVEDPPEEEGRYLVASRCGKDNHWSYDLAYYTTKLEKAYFLEDGICGAGWYMWSDYEDCDICVSPDYWMPIEPPQEDA